MLKAILAFALGRRVMVLALLLVFMGAGVAAYNSLNIEAYPNPAPPILEIVSQSPGQSAEEIERFITIPIEVAIASTPGLQYVRSISLYGLSFVRVQFTYATDYYFAYQQTLNKLNTLQLPNNVQPSISPASLTGEIFRYQLVGPPGFDLIELKTLQEWVVTRRLKTVPGVVSVVSWGGPNKEYHVDVDLNKLAAYNLTLQQVLTAVGNSNINVGGRTLSLGQQSANVRGVGLIDKVDDINNIVLQQSGGIPVLVKDVATVEVGYTPRLGIAGRDEQSDVVLAIVLMQRNEKTLEVVQRVEQEVDRINAGGILPPGVKIVPYYDRADLVGVTVHTVMHNLLFGIGLIFLIQWLFLGDLRCAIIVATTIPCALFFAAIILVVRGDSANLLSIGAIDLGIIVDGTVIMVENIFRRLQQAERRAHAERDGVETPPATALPAGDPSWSAKLRKVFAGAVEVDKPILFSIAITIAAFIPLFTMQGVEGQIFGPMARTYAYALCGALIATFTVTPVVSSLLLPDTVSEKETFAVRRLHHLYVWLQRRALDFRAVTLLAAGAVLSLVIVVGAHLGTEFLPKLEEGNLWIRASLPPTISLEGGAPIVKRIRQVLKEFPEIVTVVSQHGRPDDGTDPTGFFNAEFFAPLKPREQWRPGLTKEKLVEDMQKRFAQEFVGIEFNFSQYIQDNIQEAVSGVKGENSIKLFGKSLETLEDTAKKIQDVMETVPGVEDLGIFRELGQPNLVISVDRAQSARYGLAPGDVNAIVQAAIGGQEVTDVYEGERKFPLVVRLQPEFRSTVEQIRNIQVAAPINGQTAYIPLSDLTDIRLRSGASYIYRENNERYIPLKFSVRDRDLGSTVAEAQGKVAKQVKLPETYHLDWSGEFGALEAAQKRLAYIVPLSLFLIMIMLYSLFNSLRYSLLAVSGIPFAVCGGILALTVSGLNFSISAAVGFISLFGVSVMDGILLISSFAALYEAGMDRDAAIRQAAQARMRQMLMTALSASIGLLPAAISTGIGSQVQQPLATVIVGGMLVEPIMTLLIVPALVSVVMPRRAPALARSAAADTAEHPAPAE
ncbi:MAG: efflux RND transporter permease subunit [Alphaproteobacteria bacterium]|nr:efflux RND transporter permease subunit [Alphaproteobacteria bacterium]